MLKDRKYWRNCSSMQFNRVALASIPIYNNLLKYVSLRNSLPYTEPKPGHS